MEQAASKLYLTRNHNLQQNTLYTSVGRIHSKGQIGVSTTVLDRNRTHSPTYIRSNYITNYLAAESKSSMKPIPELATEHDPKPIPSSPIFTTHVPKVHFNLIPLSPPL
jgi:hypothetical protein